MRFDSFVCRWDTPAERLPCRGGRIDDVPRCYLDVALVFGCLVWIIDEGMVYMARRAVPPGRRDGKFRNM